MVAQTTKRVGKTLAEWDPSILNRTKELKKEEQENPWEKVIEQERRAWQDRD